MFPTIHIILPSYAVLAVTGLIIVLIFLYFRIEKYNIKKSDFLKLFLACICLGFLGSRIVFVASRVLWLFDDFSVHRLLYTIINGGYVYYGGLFGVLAGIILYCKKKGIDCLLVKNMVAPAIPLFHTFGRIGCFMAGCCYGTKYREPLVIFESIVFYRVPIQFIEAFFEFIIFILIFSFQKKFEKIDWIRNYLIIYAIFRFIIEFYRGDTIRGLVCGISTSQIISIIILLYYFIVHVIGVIRKIKGKLISKI